jgi:hypothetical protein
VIDKTHDQIKSLPPEEQAGVVLFGHELEAERKLSGTQLSVLAERFVNASDPTEASRIRREIVRGLYGGKSNA